MSEEIYKFFGITIFVLGLVSVLFTLFHMGKMFSDIKASKHKSANLVAPLLPFLASYFNESGNYHRKRFIVGLISSISIFTLLNIFFPK